MNDKMTPIRGYFKIERIEDGKVVDTYEDKNTVMVRIPQLFAGTVSGNFTKKLEENVIGCLSLGTGGTRIDTLGNVVPKEVRSDRTMLFSEHDFWNTPTQIAEGQPHVADKYKWVYQTSFDVIAHGDLGHNTSFMSDIEVKNQGTTFPHTNWVPDNYRNTTPPASDPEGLIGRMSLQQNVIQYEYTLGQFAGNADDDVAIPYTEAGMYLKLDADTKLDDFGDPIIGNPLGTLFSMKSFPEQWKNSTCSLRIEWKLFF